jgi:hypothetical protein
MIALWFAWWPVARQQWRVSLVALAGCVLPGLLILPWALPVLRAGGNIGHHFVSLPAMASTMVRAFSQGITQAAGLWSIGFALFGLLAGTFLWSGAGLIDRLHRIARDGYTRIGEESLVGIAWAWLLIPLVGLYLISTRVPMFVDRYLIWIAPAFYLLLARGLNQLRRRSMPLVSLCLAGMLTFNAVAHGQQSTAPSQYDLWQQSTEPIKSDFRAAAAYVRQHRQPGELAVFHISYVRDTFEYYGGDAAPAVGGMPTDESTTPEAVDAYMSGHTYGYSVVWLILSEPEMWDQRGMTVAWLEEHAQASERADFARVSVIRYQMSP